MSRISVALEARWMLLSLNIGFSLERPAVIWAILESISGFGSFFRCDLTYPRYVSCSPLLAFDLLH